MRMTEQTLRRVIRTVLLERLLLEIESNKKAIERLINSWVKGGGTSSSPGYDDLMGFFEREDEEAFRHMGTIAGGSGQSAKNAKQFIALINTMDMIPEDYQEAWSKYSLDGDEEGVPSFESEEAKEKRSKEIEKRKSDFDAQTKKEKEKSAPCRDVDPNTSWAELERAVKCGYDDRLIGAKYKKIKAKDYIPAEVLSYFPDFEEQSFWIQEGRLESIKFLKDFGKNIGKATTTDLIVLLNSLGRVAAELYDDPVQYFFTPLLLAFDAYLVARSAYGGNYLGVGYLILKQASPELANKIIKMMLEAPGIRNLGLIEEFSGFADYLINAAPGGGGVFSFVKTFLEFAIPDNFVKIKTSAGTIDLHPKNFESARQNLADTVTIALGRLVENIQTNVTLPSNRTRGPFKYNWFEVGGTGISSHTLIKDEFTGPIAKLFLEPGVGGKVPEAKSVEEIIENALGEKDPSELKGKLEKIGVDGKSIKDIDLENFIQGVEKIKQETPGVSDQISAELEKLGISIE